jgi:hypothetical protein
MFFKELAMMSAGIVAAVYRSHGGAGRQYARSIVASTSALANNILATLVDTVPWCDIDVEWVASAAQLTRGWGFPRFPCPVKRWRPKGPSSKFNCTGVKAEIVH